MDKPPIMLDYETPQKPVAPRWKRRYWIFVPIIGACYICFVFAFAYVASLTFGDSPPQPLHQALVDIVFAITDFPMFSVVHTHSTAIAIAMLVLNALFWGLCFVGIWHFIWSWRQRRRQ